MCKRIMLAETPTKEQIAAELRAMRIKAGLTQANLARQIRYSQRGVSAVEAGRYCVGLLVYSRWVRACEGKDNE